MTPYTSYIPDFKCIADGNGKGVVNANVGLLSYDEVIYAGGYFNQNNSNYYLYNSTYFWTMSPAGFSGSYSDVWIVDTTGNIYNNAVINTRRLRPVLNLTADTQITGGDGSKENPFTIG